MFKIFESILDKLEPKIPRPDLAKLQLSCTHNFHLVSRQQFGGCIIATHRRIHPYFFFIHIIMILVTQ